MTDFNEEDFKDFILEKYEVSSEKVTMLFQSPVYDYNEMVEEIVSKEESSFQEKLFSLIRDKGLSEVDIYTKANLTRQHFSKIRSSNTYQPTKMTVVFLAFSMKLSFDEVCDLLHRAGLSLSHSNKKDLVIEYFLCHKIYDIFLLNEILEKYGV